MGIGLRALAFGAAACCCGAAHAQDRKGQDEADPRLPHILRELTQPGAPTHPDIRVRENRTLAPPNAGQSLALPFVGEVALGIGGFSITEFPRARTNMESDPSPANIRRRERGIGGLGLRMSF